MMAYHTSLLQIELRYSILSWHKRMNQGEIHAGMVTAALLAQSNR